MKFFGGIIVVQRQDYIFNKAYVKKRIFGILSLTLKY